MEVRHKGTRLCTKFYKFVINKVWFERAYPEAFNAFYFIQGFHQIQEAFARRSAKVANVYTRQYYLFSSFCCSFLCLFYQRSYIRITRETSGKRYGTISAEVIAAILNFQEIARAVTSGATGLEFHNVFCLYRMIASRLWLSVEVVPCITKILY